MTGTDVEDARAAAELWADFPVDAKPRPLVHTGVALVDASFTSGEAKAAFHEGRIEVDSGIPGRAMASLQAAGKTKVGDAGSPVRLYDAELTTYTFHTDRGPRTLGTWRLMVTHVQCPVYVLDERERAAVWSPQNWRPNQSHEGGGNATLLTDRLGMVYRFTGSSRNRVNYPRVRLLEDRAVVVVVPVPINIGGHGASRLMP